MNVKNSFYASALRYKLIISFVFILTSIVYQASSQPVIETIISLPDDASPRDLLYNPIDNKIYTANTPDLNRPGAATESVTIIDGSTNQVIKSIPTKKGSRDFCHNTRRGCFTHCRLED